MTNILAILQDDTHLVLNLKKGQKPDVSLFVTPTGNLSNTFFLKQLLADRYITHVFSLGSPFHKVRPTILWC